MTTGSSVLKITLFVTATIIIAGLLIGPYIWSSLTSMTRNKKIEKTKRDVTTIAKAIENAEYSQQLEVKHLWELNSIYRSANVLRDPWGTPYTLSSSVMNTGPRRVISPGPDKQFDPDNPDADVNKDNITCQITRPKPPDKETGTR